LTNETLVNEKAEDDDDDELKVVELLVPLLPSLMAITYVLYEKPNTPEKVTPDIAKEEETLKMGVTTVIVTLFSVTLNSEF